MKMLELKNVSKTFAAGTPDEKIAVKNFDLSLTKGDFVSIIGSNGAGKSTLFSLISGQIISDNGKIFLNDQDITFLPEYKRSKKIGRLFQDPLSGTAPHMTIEENMALSYLKAGGGNAFSRISKKDRDFFKQKLSTLEIGLENRMTMQVGLLSGGQRQALTLLMATLVVPSLLLLDEHTAALDPEAAGKILSLTKKIANENNLTCMMITHNIEDAIKTGNRLIMLDNGRIMLDLSQKEKLEMTSEKLIGIFGEKAKEKTVSDRMLFSI